jgi:hypothetical protein
VTAEDLEHIKSSLLDGSQSPAEACALVDRIAAEAAPADARRLLAGLLAAELDHGVAVRVLRALGRVADASSLAAIGPRLAADDPEMRAAAVEAAIRADPVRGLEIAAPVLESGDPAMRSLAARAMLDVGGDQGTGALVTLCFAGAKTKRRLALDILSSVSADLAWPLFMRMFEVETDHELLEDQAAALERVLPERGIEKLYEIRLGLDLALDDARPGVDERLVEARMDLVARILATLFRTFRLTEAEIDALENAFHERASRMLTRLKDPSARGDPRTLGEIRARRRAPVPGTRPGLATALAARPRLAAAMVGALLVLGLVALSSLSGRGRSARAARRPPEAGPSASALGRIGQDVSVTAEVLMVDPGGRAMALLKDRSIGIWVDVRCDADWDRLTPGALAAVTGRITRVKDHRNLYLEAGSVQVTEP